MYVLTICYYNQVNLSSAWDIELSICKSFAKPSQEYWQRYTLNKSPCILSRLPSTNYICSAENHIRPGESYIFIMPLFAVHSVWIKYNFPDISKQVINKQKLQE